MLFSSFPKIRSRKANNWNETRVSVLDIDTSEFRVENRFDLNVPTESSLSVHSARLPNRAIGEESICRSIYNVVVKQTGRREVVVPRVYLSSHKSPIDPFIRYLEASCITRMHRVANLFPTFCCKNFRIRSFRYFQTFRLSIRTFAKLTRCVSSFNLRNP